MLTLDTKSTEFAQLSVVAQLDETQGLAVSMWLPCAMQLQTSVLAINSLEF